MAGNCPSCSAGLAALRHRMVLGDVVYCGDCRRVVYTTPPGRWVVAVDGSEVYAATSHYDARKTQVELERRYPADVITIEWRGAVAA